MEHNEAIENHTAERYLLHELTEQERDAYEEHFFSCSACAEEIKAASEFMENARKVVQSELLPAHVYGDAVRRSIWGSWLNFRSMLYPIPAAACVLLVAVSAFGIYQNQVTIPQLRDQASAQLVTPQPIMRHSKGEAVTALAVHRGRGFLLRLDIPGESSSYGVSVLSSSNARKFSVKNISRQDTNQALEIFVPADTLDAGRYFLLIEDENSKGEVDRIPFDIKFQD